MATTLTRIKKQNEINEEEFNDITKLLYSSFLLKRSTKDPSIIEKKLFLLTSFAELMNQYLELRMVDRKNRLELINFIDKLNLQKELLDIQKGVTDIRTIKETAQRFGRKSQSVFITK
jgi:hypothetical protein